jgi:UDP-2-acetamido-2-deoxy-ribo-hexuluronate aminotransferase
MKIPMLDLKREYSYMKADIDAAIARCLDHQQWILGPEVKEFEDRVAKYLGAKHCIGTSSGTDALVLALRALALKTKGQEYFGRSDLIITTPFTFTATGDAILRAGATPAFVDIDRSTFNIDPSRIREFIQSEIRNPEFEICGILPVHLYGQSCQMDAIMAIAKEYGLFVVEDVAQAFGGSYRAERLGTIGDAGAFSFFPSKNLGGFGDAGMVSTDDDGVADLIRMLTRHGGRDKYNANHIGYNARLDTLQAAILLSRFKYLDEFNKCRRRIALAYCDLLKDVPGLVLPVEKDRFLHDRAEPSHVFHQFTVRVSDRTRDSLLVRLKESSIDCAVYYPVPLHKMGVLEERCKKLDDLSNAEQASTEVLSLPVEPLMTDEEQAVVVEGIRRATSQ